MGILHLALGKEQLKMLKSIAFACLVAVAFADAEAKPEAEADAYYGYYGHGLGYAGYGYGHGLGYAGYGYGHGLGYRGYYGKRSADAEPTAAAEPKADADAYYGYYGHGLGYGGYGHGYGYGVDTATTARGLLMPSPLLSPRLMLTTATTDTVWDTSDTDTATDTPDTDTDMDAATDTATATATTARFPNCLPNNISKQFYIKIFH